MRLSFGSSWITSSTMRGTTTFPVRAINFACRTIRGSSHPNLPWSFSATSATSAGEIKSWKRRSSAACHTAMSRPFGLVKAEISTLVSRTACMPPLGAVLMDKPVDVFGFDAELFRLGGPVAAEFLRLAFQFLRSHVRLPLFRLDFPHQLHGPGFVVGLWFVFLRLTEALVEAEHLAQQRGGGPVLPAGELFHAARQRRRHGKFSRFHRST